jgi:preprotein translocase subunit SecB
MNPFVLEHTPEELRLTAEFQSQMLAMTSVTLKSFSARRTDEEPEVVKGLKLDLKHQADHCHVSGPNACFDVSLTIDALADGDPDKLLFHVDCVFELVCELDENFSPTPEHLAAFRRGNAVFVCWPYMREFVQSATARLGLSVPSIPPLRVTTGKPDLGSETVDAGRDAVAERAETTRKRRTPKRSSLKKRS